MRFLVKALGAEHSVSEILVDAVDEASARQLIGGRGLTVLSVRRQGGVVRTGRSRRFPLALFSQELLALLQSGLALVESIETLVEKENRPQVRATLEGLIRGLREGRTLSAVLEAQPGTFPDLYVSMIRAAERTSDLDQALARYISYRKEMDVLRGKMVNAAIYPVLLLCISGLVVLFLMGYVVPRFSGIFEEAGGELPLASKLLIQWGSLVEKNALGMAIAAVVFVIGIIMAIRNPAVRAVAGRSLWRIPTIGENLKVFQLARFYRTLSMLLQGGITVLVAMQMSRDLLSASLRQGLDAAMGKVREGKGLADSLATNGLTTPVANRMLRVGERAGNLGEMAERIAVFHEEEISRWVDLLTRLVGPSLMLIIGIVIGLIVVLMYLPIFQLAESIQ